MIPHLNIFDGLSKIQFLKSLGQGFSRLWIPAHKIKVIIHHIIPFFHNVLTLGRPVDRNGAVPGGRPFILNVQSVFDIKHPEYWSDGVMEREGWRDGVLE